MKKFIVLSILAFMALFSSIGATAQELVKQNGYMYAGGTPADTVLKDGIKYYTYYNKLVYGVSFNVKATRQTGAYTKMRYVLQKSFDYSKWYAVDSVAIGSATTPYTTILEFKTVYAPYYRVKAYAYDSTQKIKSEFVILTEIK